MASNSAYISEKSTDYSITLLRSKGPRLAKRVNTDGTIDGYEDAKYYSVTSVVCRDLPAIRDLLRRIGPDPRTCMIRGELIDANAAKDTQRRNATFSEVPRFILALDGDEADTVEQLVSSLPDAFHGVSYVRQWTGSHGFKPGARCRLVYILDKPLTGPQVSRWMTDAGSIVDHCVFRRVQPIYTAFPVLAPGVVDPTGGKRVEIIESDWPVVSVPDDVLALPAQPAADGTGDTIAATCSEQVREGMLAHLRTREYPKRHDGIGSWMGDAILAGLGSDEIAEAASERFAALDPEREPDVIAGEVQRLMEHQQRKAAAGSLHFSDWARAIVEAGDFPNDLATDAKPASLVLRTHADRMRDRWQPRAMLAAGLLPADGLGAFIALPGKGKSVMLAELSHRVATGEAFAGHAVMQGRVIYACPDSPASTERRLLALPAEAAARVLTLPDLPAMPRSIPALRAAVEQVNATPGKPVRLLVIDTWDASRDHADSGYAGQDGVRRHRVARCVAAGLRPDAVPSAAITWHLHPAPAIDRARPCSHRGSLPWRLPSRTRGADDLSRGGARDRQALPAGPWPRVPSRLPSRAAGARSAARPGPLPRPAPVAGGPVLVRAMRHPRPLVAYCLAVAADGSAFVFDRSYRPLCFVDAATVRRWATAPTQRHPWHLHSNLAIPAGFRPVEAIWLHNDAMPMAERRKRFTLGR